MKQFKLPGALRALLPAAMLLALASCSTPYNVAYFQDMPIDQEVKITEPKSIALKPGDQVSILVSCRDQALSSLFSLYSTYNVGDASGGGSYSSNYRTSNYFVGADGGIDFPVLGRLHVEGLSREELQQYIKEKIQEQNLVKDPVVTVEFQNLFVTMIGATGHVGRIQIDRDQFTLLDAISQAGDLELAGQRENVRIIRQTGLNTREAYEINMCSAEELYNSPAYYLQQNDVIYVEPNNKVKRTTTEYGSSMVNYTFWVGIVTSALTLIAIFK